MKRPLCLAAGGFVLGEAAVLLHLTMETAAVLLIGTVFAVGFKRSRRAGWLPLLLIFVFIGLIRGGWWEKKLQNWEEQLSGLEGGFVQVEGSVESWMEEDGILKLTLKECRMRADGPLLMKMDVSLDQASLQTEHGIHIGSPMRVSGYLKPLPQARNPGEFDYRSYKYALGVGCRLEGAQGAVTGGGREPLPDLLHHIRMAAALRINRIAQPEDAGILNAAILGEKSALDSAIRDLYQRNGIAHLLAISGLHLSIVGMGLYKIIRKTGAGYGTAALAGASFVFAYGMMTGGASSIVRASIMMTTGFLASCAGRTYDLLSAMSLSALVLLWQCPGQLAQGGFQLSFGAIGAIGTVLPVLEKWLDAKGCKAEGLISALLASCSVQLVTAPVILWNFYQFPLYGVLLNLVVIPLMGFVICSGLAGIFVSFLGIQAGIAALGPGHYILAFYQWLCSLVSGFPWSNIVMGRPSWGQICFYYGVLLTVLFLIKRQTLRNTIEKEKSKDKEENEETEKRKVLRLCLCITAVLTAGTAGMLILKPFPVSGMDVLWMDVGQGDGCLIRTGANTVLIDGGSTSEKSLGRYRLEPCLKSYGISEIDYAFISHGDQDHISGVIYLLKESRDIRIKRLLLPCLGDGDKGIQELKALAGERKIPVSEVKAGDSFRIGGMVVSCLYPGPDDPAGDVNEESVVLKIDYGACHMLFTGDMSADGEKRLLSRLDTLPFKSASVLKDIQILKTAHHGSKYSSDSDFLDAMGVRFAVLSYGAGNSYGHPHKEVLERLADHQVRVWETAGAGAVSLHTDGRRVKWECFIDGTGDSQYNGDMKAFNAGKTGSTGQQ